MGTLGVTDDSNSISQMSLNSGINSILSTPPNSVLRQGGGFGTVDSGMANTKDGIDISGGGVKQGLATPMDQATTTTDKPMTSAPATSVRYENENKKMKDSKEKPKSGKRLSTDLKAKSMPHMSNKITPLTDRKVSVASVTGSALSFKSNKVVPAIGKAEATEMHTLNGVPSANVVSVSVEVHREKSRTPSLTIQPGDEEHDNAESQQQDDKDKAVNESEA